ncbi:MAG: hypothetical protein HY661_07395 [Betaproteobacteria bacterium]|nr:hypothetical protein [Betaproteobacteria bacterium]
MSTPLTNERLAGLLPRNKNALREQGVDTASNFVAKNSGPRGIKQHAKRLIVGMALWGLLPIKSADWIIRRGWLRDA